MLAASHCCFLASYHHLSLMSRFRGPYCLLPMYKASLLSGSLLQAHTCLLMGGLTLSFVPSTKLGLPFV